MSSWDTGEHEQKDVSGNKGGGNKWSLDGIECKVATFEVLEIIVYEEAFESVMNIRDSAALVVLPKPRGFAPL